eukprot:TRINITY_DN47430_c0_g1_i1.p1 TRINITY_DN47430_c0_g1~~TRINITY_DN47430_c0_g1_i1.p1  ORF type:complete len:297 (+),score=32.66 TRINITY_DN47430_c0_g1_i1:80-970(+)
MGCGSSAPQQHGPLPRAQSCLLRDAQLEQYSKITQHHQSYGNLRAEPSALVTGVRMARVSAVSRAKLALAGDLYDDDMSEGSLTEADERRCKKWAQEVVLPSPTAAADGFDCLSRSSYSSVHTDHEGEAELVPVVVVPPELRGIPSLPAPRRLLDSAQLKELRHYNTHRDQVIAEADSRPGTAASQGSQVWSTVDNFSFASGTPKHRDKPSGLFVGTSPDSPETRTSTAPQEGRTSFQDLRVESLCSPSAIPTSLQEQPSAPAEGQAHPAAAEPNPPPAGDHSHSAAEPQEGEPAG